MLKSSQKKQRSQSNNEAKPWKKPKLTYEATISSVKDTEEKELESFLFGGDSGNLLLESNYDDITASVEASDNEEENLLSFSISTKPDTLDDNSKEDVFTLKTPVYKAKAVWNDPDDVNVSVDVENNKRLRKLRKSHDEKVLSGTIFQERLKNQFEKIIPTPAWADLSNKAVDDDQESEHEEDRIFKSTQYVVTKGSHLPKHLLKINRVRDLNHSHPSNGTITSVEFHPSAKIAFTASLNQKLTLFQVDGNENQKLQSIHLSKFPIHAAHFMPHGDKVIMSSQRKFYYSYDLVSGQIIKIPEIRGHSEKSLDRFIISPDGEIIAFLGSSGYIHLVSSKNHQWMSSLKINGHVFTVAFSPDSSNLFAAGSDGEVYIWDLRSCRCRHRFVDDGSIATHSLAISGNGKYLACGSSSGVVNIYDDCYHEKKHPSPSKVLLNLTTRIAGTKFNSTSEILAYYSPQVRNALKLVHFPSLTTFSNWPVNKQTLGNVSSVDFSPFSGYVAVGNENGKALLFRLAHYPDS